MARKTKKIRVGMIRCDKRALWYGAVFDTIDPMAYTKLDPARYHHMTYYSLKKLNHEPARGFKLVKVYDRNRKAAECMAAAFRGRPEVCKTLEEASDGVDLVFIANETGDGRDHLKLATPGLRKGVPTFIDRPLARTVKDAKALIRLAKRNKTMLLSCSALRMQPHAQRFKSRFAELDPLERCNVQGFGPSIADAADGVELGLSLFGDEFRGRVDCVQSMGGHPLEIMLVTYTKPRTERVLHVVIVNSHCGGARHAFHAAAGSNFKPIYLDDLDLFVQPEGARALMNAIKKGISTGKPPVSYDEMIETVAVIEAGRRSHNKARPVPLKRLR